MSSVKARITASLRIALEAGLDASLARFRFTRRKNSLIYSRKLAQAIQKIDISIEGHPADRREAAAAIYPWLEVTVPAVNELLPQMIGGGASQLPGLAGSTLRQPVEFTSAKAAQARWFILETDSVAGVVSELKSFLQRWTLPFLDCYSTPAGMCEAYDDGDARVINTLDQKLRVAAAMVACNRVADGLAVMDRWFGKPGPRKQYQRVFDYLAARCGANRRE